MTIRNPLVLVSGRISELPTGDSLASAAPINTGAVQQLGKVITTGSQTTVTFSNIPQNFTNLRLVSSCRDTASGTGDALASIQINGDATAANYSSTQHCYSNASATTSTTVASSTAGSVCIASPGTSANANAFGTSETLFAGYTNSFNKVIRTNSNSYNGAATNTTCGMNEFVWKSNSAITSILITKSVTAFADGSTFLLLGEGPTNYSVSPFVDPARCNGRLSLTSGIPITTADVIGATIIYWTPYLGNQISLYSNGAWSTISSAEVSLALGTLTAAKNYDVFAYNNNGVLTLEFLVWTSDTARATALVMQDGVYVKSGDATRRYLGTFRTTTTTTTEDSGGGVTTQVGGKRFLWNFYNRVRRPFSVFDSTAQYTYTAATWRQQNAAVGNKVEMIIGLATESIDFTVSDGIQIVSTTTHTAKIAVGVDSTTVPSGSIYGVMSSGTGAPVVTAFAKYEGFPGIGYHALNCLQNGGAAGTNSFYGIVAAEQPISQGGIEG